VDLIGTRIGSYVVDRQLGAGGAGTVYACRHTMIDREVAVKVLHDEHVRDPDQVARFFQEAKAAADIGHPNIIVIIDYGTLELPGGPRTYVMMESLEGESLDKRMRRGGLSLDDILHIFTQIASALIACHGKGIIHRDLKPSNIFLCHRSFDPMFVKVLDFGTAKLTAPTPDMRRTQYGIVIGTPAYMSPEQCEGKGAIDHRSDIYSLGVMLYEMLTGTLPFEGEISDILFAHLMRTPDPPRQRNPSIPPEWEALCLRMMEKSREARFQSVTQLAHALEDLRGHAAAYEAARVERAGSGHSGHTLVSGTSNDSRTTLRVDVGEVVPTGAYPPAQPSPLRAADHVRIVRSAQRVRLARRGSAPRRVPAHADGTAGGPLVRGCRGVPDREGGSAGDAADGSRPVRGLARASVPRPEPRGRGILVPAFRLERGGAV
jgi:serine/threonine protein kinase